MKKVLAVTIALVMLLSFGACGDKNNEIDQPEVDTREGYENLQLTLGSGLPIITMWGTYYLNEISDELAANGMVASYYTDLASEPDYDFYQWEKGDKTLEEIATTKLPGHDGVDAVAEYQKFNTFDDAEVTDFYHYTSLAQRDGKTYIVQTYFFEEEESYMAVDRWFETNPIETGVGDFVIQLPALYTETGYTDETPDELVAAYYDRDGRLPYVFIFKDESSASTEEYLEELKAQYNASAANTLVYTAADGKTYSGGFLRFTETQNDEKYNESTYFINLGDQKLRVNFLVIGDRLPSSMVIPTLYQAIQTK